jgi:O-antigen/teichoic acid export membrane protein
MSVPGVSRAQPAPPPSTMCDDATLDMTDSLPPLVAPPETRGAPAAAEGKKPSMKFLVGSLVGGNIVALGLRTIGGLLQVNCVMPVTYGFWNTIGLVQPYIHFLQFGVLNGMNRELPYFIGKGDRRHVEELAAAAQAWAILVGGFVAAILAFLGVWQLAAGNLPLAAGLLTNAVLAFLLFYNTYYLQMTYRTGHDFARLAMAGVVESTVALLLVGLVALWNFYGMCLRSVATALVSVAFLYYWRPLRVGLHWNTQHLVHLFKIGAPIFAVGYVYSLWATLNTTMVAWRLGNAAMGLYGVVLIAGSAMEQLPSAVGQVLYPRMAEQYGRTDSLTDVVRMAIKPMLVSAGGVALLVAAAWPLVEPVTRLLLPKYVEAAPTVQWYLLIPVVQCFWPISLVYNIAKRQDLLLAAILLGMAANAGAFVFLWLTRGGISLPAFPQAMIVGRCAAVGACYVLLFLLARQRRAAA